MNVWIVTVGEPLPTDEGSVRLYRSGLLFDELKRSGHCVVWWTSAFNHSAKQQRLNGDFATADGKARIVLLEGPSYRKNISVARVLNHTAVAKNFRAKIESEPVPDVIVCSFPTIELCYIAASYGLQHNIPVVMDVRDLWPDIFLDFVPGWARTCAHFLLRKMFIQTQYVFKNSASIFGVSESYLQWGLNKAMRSRHVHDHVIPLGYPSCQLLPHDEKMREFLEKHQIDPSKSIMLFIGTFGKTYDLLPIIGAARSLAEADEEIQFVFCGDGENRQRWQSASRGLPNIIFTGWLGGMDLRRLLSVARVGLAAYKKGAPQGLPNKIFEYMSHGLPILSSLEGETRDLIEQEGIGLTYDSENPADIFEKVERILEPNFTKASGSRSLLLFESQFSASSVYKKYRCVLEELTLDYNRQRLG